MGMVVNSSLWGFVMVQCEKNIAILYLKWFIGFNEKGENGFYRQG